MAEIILASASPRRRELLALAGVDFTVKVADVEEIIPENASPDEVVKSLALQKAQAVAQMNPDSIVIGSDTVVALGNTILGKPQDEENAVEMLTMLSGRAHTVYTGVAIICGEIIRDYVATKEPNDKAGAYGIQGKGCVLVEKIVGDYFNVVGLPVSRVYRELKTFAE